MQVSRSIDASDAVAAAIDRLAVAVEAPQTQ